MLTANYAWFATIRRNEKTMNNLQPFKRKKVFIQPAFQGKFIFWIILVIALAGSVSALLLYFMLTGDFKTQSQSAHVVLAESWQRLGLSIFIGNLMAIIIGAVIAAIIVLYRSHKIAGPLHRFCRVFQEIGEGRYSDMVHLRENDELLEVADSIQAMMEKLKARSEQRLLHAQTALDAVLEMEKKYGGDDSLKLPLQKAREALSQLLAQQWY